MIHSVIHSFIVYKLLSEGVGNQYARKTNLKMTELPQSVKDAILAPSDPVPEDSEEVRGYDFSVGVDYDALLDSYRTTGFQATNFGKAVKEINQMVS